MSKRLLILRHAEAAPATNGDDFARRLTSRGKGDARALGAAMSKRLPAPSTSFVSPAQRTVETFEVFVAAAGWKQKPSFDPALYEATPEMVLDVIAGAGSADCVLVVGHNPTLAELASAGAVTGEPRALARLRHQFPAPCLAALVFEAATWDAIDLRTGHLDYFLTPDALA